MPTPIPALVRQAHGITEQAAATETDSRERKKLVLADLALHSAQAALHRPQPDAQQLKPCLFSILTVANSFIDDLDLDLTLKPTAKVLLSASQPPPAPPRSAAAGPGLT